MKITLDNSIISLQQFNIIENLLKINYNLVFGGSLALNCYGIVKRPIGDIDIVTGHRYGRSFLEIELRKRNFQKIESGSFQLSRETVGIAQRDSYKTSEGHKICVFLRNEEIKGTRNINLIWEDKQININICDHKDIIEAKKFYIENLGSSAPEKHKLDLINYKEWIIKEKIKSLFEITKNTEYERLVREYLNKEKISRSDKIVLNTIYNRIKFIKNET